MQANSWQEEVLMFLIQASSTSLVTAIEGNRFSACQLNYAYMKQLARQLCAAREINDTLGQRRR